MPGHPHFPSALSWHTHLSEAIAEASAGGKRIFVQHGHQRCAGSRALVEKVLAKDEIAEYVAENYVVVASNSEAPGGINDFVPLPGSFVRQVAQLRLQTHEDCDRELE